MSLPIRKITCRTCNRTIDAIIVKGEYGVKDKKDDNVTHYFQKLIIMDHRRSIWRSKHCTSSRKKITVHTGSSDVQNHGGRSGWNY
jgi:hypothetical protein